MHYFGIITTLPFSKYARPIFAQRKPNSRLRLLVDLRKINNLISDKYNNNNHPVSTLTDAAQHLAGKKLFCKLDSSQAYHVLQMADQKSVQLLAFNFASRTFAILRLAHGLSRSLASFSSFMREYLAKAIKAEKCAQYVDDIGISTNTPDELKNNLKNSGSQWPNVSSAPRKSNSLGGRSPHQVWHPRATRSRSNYRPSNSPERRKDFKGTSDL